MRRDHKNHIGSPCRPVFAFPFEIKLMKAVGSHKNIVIFIGCCTKSTPNFLVVEFAAKGDLLSYMRARRKKVNVIAYVCSVM